MELRRTQRAFNSGEWWHRGHLASASDIAAAAAYPVEEDFPRDAVFPAFAVADGQRAPITLIATARAHELAQRARIEAPAAGLEEGVQPRAVDHYKIKSRSSFNSQEYITVLNYISHSWS